ncbi:hypothetical protein [Pseudomonas sp. BDPW]|uniref:hypothetical protein n=1 Tax=Pseudomonas sp. BDPW TaxID=2806612 RepID=UPI00193BD2C7|nr:hypothetical protein [Pseudomonas sp. BDPW]MBM2600787.1 hypothetical protein [Pseudomonas sp. BDPW]
MFGVNHHIHIANKTSGPVYVVASPTLGWTIRDFVFDVGLLLLGVGEIKYGVTLGSRLPSAIKSFNDLGCYLKVAAWITSGALSSSLRAKEAADSMINLLKKSSIMIGVDEYKDVYSRGALDLFTTPSGYNSLLGIINDVSLIVYAEKPSVVNSMAKVIRFNSNSDHSWIADETGIWRAKYGTIFERSQDVTIHDWDF